MSYIRSISNPEGLYIFGNQHGEVEIYKAGNSISKRLPTKIFNGLISKYAKSFEDCKYRGAEIKEIFVKGQYRQRLKYKKWHIDMWDVTWAYIVLTNYKEK